MLSNEQIPVDANFVAREEFTRIMRENLALKDQISVLKANQQPTSHRGPGAEPRSPSALSGLNKASTQAPKEARTANMIASEATAVAIGKGLLAQAQGSTQTAALAEKAPLLTEEEYAT